MSESTIDVDLDALAPVPKRVRLNGKTWRLPGDMPMDLFFRTQRYGQRVEAGEDEAQLIVELEQDILGLFQVHQPTLKKLPPVGVTQLLRTLSAVYGPGGDAGGEAPANRAERRAATSRSRRRTSSSTPPTGRGRAAAT